MAKGWRPRSYVQYTDAEGVQQTFGRSKRRFTTTRPGSEAASRMSSQTQQAQGAAERLAKAMADSESGSEA